MTPRLELVVPAVVSLFVGLPAASREARGQDPAPKPAPAPGAPPAPGNPPAANPPAGGANPDSPQGGGASGAISEEEFKALHQLRQDAPPQLHGTMVTLGSDQAYLSLPANATPGQPLPAVLVIHEWWGLNANVKHWADRLAAEGYAALAVDLYGGHVATTPDDAMATMKAVDPAVAVRRLKAGVAFLKDDARIHATKIASIGWCFGGHWSLAIAIEVPLSASVVYYGGQLETDPARLRTIKGPVCGIFGTRDASIPPAQVEAFDRGLTQANVVHEIHRFDAEHAFGNPSNPHYDTASATEAWIRARAFLARHLKP